jgi:thiol-disulfide isomerase/thioredoxin
MVVGCGSGDPPAAHEVVAEPPAAVEWYRARVGSAEEEVPFYLGVPRAGTRGACTIVNGDERLPTACTWTDATNLVVDFPMYATRIQATRDAAGALAGSWQMSRILHKSAPFVATPIASPDPLLRFAAPATRATADVSGTWSLEFKALEVSKGVVTQHPDGVATATIVSGTIGDLRALAGTVHDNVLQLSTFDGQHAYLVRATLGPHDRLEGEFHFTGQFSDRFTGTRVAALAIDSIDKLRLRPGARTVTIPQLDDPRYRGKPVLVDYFGTWCPACMDQTPVLVELYRRHHAEGLEILSIALEGTDDAAYNRRQVEYFRAQYNVPWPIVVVDGEYNDVQSHLPPELDGTGAFPMTLFLDRDRSVRDLHTGFLRADGGADYRSQVERLERAAAAIVASPRVP